MTEPGRVYAGIALADRRADQRERLLDAAMGVFARDGYASSSVDDIVAGAHVSRTAFYRCFTNKEECLLVLVQERVAALAETWAAALDGAGSPVALVHAGVRSLVSTFAADPAATRVLLVEVVGATPRIEAARHAARLQFAGVIEAQLALVPGWDVRPHQERHVAAIATMAAVVEPISVLSASGELAQQAQTLADQLTAYALRALAPPV